MAENRAIFITGTGRSGTNIFKGVLSNHSRVATLPFEYRFTVDPRGIFDFYNTFPSIWTPYWADAKIKDLESFLLSLAERSADDNLNFGDNSKTTPTPYSGWELNKWIPDYERFVNELISSLIEFKYHSRWPGTAHGIENNQMYFSKNMSQKDLISPLSIFLNSCFSSICASGNKDFLVEDNTHNILFAKSINEIIPGGKLAHIIRDPRDVIASLMTQRWAPKDLEACTTWYLEVIHKWFEQRSLIPDSFYTEIRFEDLVNKTSNTLEAFAAWSGIDTQKSMLEVDLSKSNIGRHKSQFTRREKSNLDSRLASILEEYSYI